MSNNVRVRFAPSPTGPLHIGGVRTALYNYLFAKKHKGTFVLRIEDTDQNRLVKNAEKYIIDALEWSGIPYDEGINKNEKFGPYRQSDRREIYKEYIEKLITLEKAYYAFDTSEELNKLRTEAEKNKDKFVYGIENRENLNNSIALSQEEVKRKIEGGEKYVVRFKVPANEIIEMYDEIRGTISVKTNTIDDKILYKSDGMPTYHLANIVDDHLMQISHVIRGEEWLPSMPLHVLLYHAFGWDAPKFAHLPLILKPVGKGKLSKRDGDKLGFPVFPLAYQNEKEGTISTGYKESGYFPEAFINMLAFLGWNPGTEEEIFSLEKLIETFSLERVSKSGARFSKDKAEWFNQQYMQQIPNNRLVAILKKERKNGNVSEVSDTYIEKVVDLIKERAVFTQDLASLSTYFFETPLEYDPKAVKKQWKEGTGEIMKEISTVIERLENYEDKNIEREIKNWIKERELGFGKVMPPLRLAMVGKLQGPDLFVIMEMIGKKETIKRINNSITTLK